MLDCGRNLENLENLKNPKNLENLKNPKNLENPENLENLENPKNLENLKNPHRHRENMQTPQRNTRNPEWNPGPCCCEATVVTMATRCRPFFKLPLKTTKGESYKQTK